MCGRCYRKSDKQKIAKSFHVKHVGDFPLPPADYNIAPSTMQPVIRNNRDDGERELVSLRWGLIPFWTHDLKSFKGFSTINARAETIATSRTYRESFKKGRRCLIPASGFYEWKRVGGKLAAKSGQEKIPFALDLANGHMLALAGLWDAWKNPADGSWCRASPSSPATRTSSWPRCAIACRSSCTRATSTLGSSAAKPTSRRSILRPFPADEMETFQVSKDVSNNSAELLNSR